MNVNQLTWFLQHLPIGALWRFEQESHHTSHFYSWLYEKVAVDEHDFVNVGRIPGRVVSEAYVIAEAKNAIRLEWTVTFREVDEPIPDSTIRPVKRIRCPHCGGTGKLESAQQAEVEK